MASRWNYHKGNIYKFIARKYSLPTLLENLDEVKGKFVRDYWNGRYGNRLYIIFQNNLALQLISDTDYDGALDSPGMEHEIDYDYILDMREYQAYVRGDRPRDRDYAYDIWKDEAMMEMSKLTSEFDEAEEERRKQRDYELLKEYFEGK